MPKPSASSQSWAAPLPLRVLPLLGVLLLAFALRAWGLTWGLPSATHYFSYHPDESRVLGASSLPVMNVFAGRLLPHFYHYGSLQLYLVCFANTLAALAGATDIVPKDLAVWYPQWAKMYLVGRGLSVGMGVGTVLAVYGIGERLWGHRAGLLAALTLAVMPLHAQHSHFLTVDVPATFWAMLSLLQSVRLATGAPKPWRAALWAGVFVGLAAATKYNLALAILPLVVAALAPPAPTTVDGAEVGGEAPPAPNNGGAGEESRGASATFRLAPPLLGAGGAVLAFFLACPGAILENAQFLRDLRFEAVHVQNGDDPTFRDTGSGFVYHVARNLDAGLGLPLLLLALISVGYALYKRERGDGLLAAFALPYYVLISLAAVRYARYTIPLLPVLALWVGRMAAEWSRAAAPAVRGVAAWGGVSILLLTLMYSAAVIEPMADQDPRDKAYADIQNRALTASVAFPTMPWFGTAPISPYFSMPQRGGWRWVISPQEAARMIYEGKDWDTTLLETKKPDFVVLSEYDYADALRLKDPDALRYLAALHRAYGARYVNIFPFDPVTLFVLPPSNGVFPPHGLPHDMLYTNPYIMIYQRKP